MALNNRPPLPKTVKVKQPSRRRKYKADNHLCEICLLEGKYTEATEVHHIIPGHGRTDELWNFASLCHDCHEMCTEHKHGLSAWQKNLVLFAVKALKGEVSNSKLQDLDLYTEVHAAIRLIEPQFNKYKEGKNVK